VVRALVPALQVALDLNRLDVRPEGRSRTAALHTRIMTLPGESKPVFRWREDGVIGGHARYCVEPCHSLMEYCEADPREPATMHGGASEAFKRDHPREAAGVA
jgi:hypothetical protein